MLPVAILVPVLGRPHRVAPTMQSVAAATPSPYRLLFIASRGDRDELAALNDAGADYVVIGHPGTYARKINLGARATTEPLLFTAADDLEFHAGWLDAAVAKLDGTVQVVGTNDLGNPRTIRGEHSTHTLVTRSYLDDPGGVVDGARGQVLCELYPHDYCDDEFIQTAQSRGVYAHAPDSHVEHLHFLWGKNEIDSTYQLGMRGHGQGRRIYTRRRHMWAS